MRWRTASAASAGWLAVALTCGAPAAAAPTRAEGRLVLPAPAVGIDVVEGAPVKAERLKKSHVPAPVVDTERVRVELAPDGTPVAVRMLQRIELSGTGDYVIRERGPALRVRTVGDTSAPVLQRGAVVWQGFVPGRKTLEAEMDLDPVLESPRLPLTVGLDWRPASGTAAVQPGGLLPGAGTLVITLTNRTGTPQTLPTGQAAATDLAAPLDALLAHARTPRGAPPAAGRGLPSELPATGVTGRDATVVAPLQVSGSVRVVGAAATVAGAGTSPIADGAELSGVLHASTQLTVAVPAGGGRLELALSARPTLDERTLTPPAGTSWADWAAARPDVSAVRRATDTLVDAAAAAARGLEYAPYLGLTVPGEVTTTFEYVVARAPDVARAARRLTPRPGNIALAVVALLGVVGNSALLWRRL